MKQDKKSFTIGLCLEKGPEERTLMPIQADEDESIDRTPQDEKLPPEPKISLSTDEIYKVGCLIDAIRTKLDELEKIVHIHRLGPDECPF